MCEIILIDASAGAGKTRVLMEEADRLARLDQKVLIVMPTTVLIQETVANELARLTPPYPVTAIHSCTHPGNVNGAIINHFVNAQPGGEILFITHAALLAEPNLAGAGRYWTVMVDEVPDVHAFHSITVPDNHRMITDHVQLEPFRDGYAKLLPLKNLSPAAINRHRDAVFNCLQSIAGPIRSEYKDVYVREADYQKLLDGLEDKLTTLAILKPSILTQFKMAYIASACLKDTLLYYAWKPHGVVMRDAPASLMDRLRYRHHANGATMTFYYVSQSDWSKNKRDRKLKIDGCEIVDADVFDGCLGLVSTLFGEEFAYMANNDTEKRVARAFPKATQLPGVPHGLNIFQSFDDIVVFSALNLFGPHRTMLEDILQVGYTAIRTAIYATACYQAAMRGSARKPLDQSPKRIVLMDRFAAEWLSKRFPGSRVEHLGGIEHATEEKKPGRKRVYKSAAEKMRVWRAENKKKAA